MNSELREALYTLRWHLTHQETEEALAILASLLGEAPSATLPCPAPAPLAPSPLPASPSLPPLAPFPLPAPAKALWIPFAQVCKNRSKTKGQYDKGYPEGAVIHFTGGSPNQTISDGIDFQVCQGYTYLFIDKDGNVGQNFPLNEWGYHAGESFWKGIGHSISSHLVGIEIACPGKLMIDGSPDFNPSHPYDRSMIRDAIKRGDNTEAGLYYRYTPAQEQALIHLLCWLYGNCPSVFSLDLVLGHDEVAGPKGLGYWRKNDPGGSLSCSMTDLRKQLHLLCKA